MSDQRVLAAKRMLAIREAQDDLLRFTQLWMPDPKEPDNPDKSSFEATPLARLLCQIIEKAERGQGKKRIAVSVGPQHGKSQVLSRSAPAWIQGRNPYANQILATYNQPFANEFGDAVREVMRSPTYAQVFPKAVLRREMADLLITDAGGRMAFVGRGGSGTGKPADFFFVDDPIKDQAEAQSDVIRNDTWSWFTKVAMTRCHSRSLIIVVHTRWSTDDLIGRLCDPDHPERDKIYKNIARNWDYYNIPAVIDDPKLAKALGLKLEPPTNPDVISMFGTRPMTALWPNRKSLEFLAESKNMDPAGFSALYMGKPTPDEGDYFKSDWLIEYEPDDLPENLTIYGASDHAVSIKQGRDYTVIGCVGVDEKDNIWVLPDLMRDRIETDRTVDELVHQMKEHSPSLWWMEGELISKAFGPFLYKRMQEERVYSPIDPVNIAKDKRTMARSIQGRMQMRKVRFPRFAHWWPEAKQELLRFDSGAHDDFVTWLSLIGHGLNKQFKPSEAEIENAGPPVGSIKWILDSTKKRVEREKRETAAAGW
jgi:predicted phage terminase large subunit-like protein